MDSCRPPPQVTRLPGCPLAKVGVAAVQPLLGGGSVKPEAILDLLAGWHKIFFQAFRQSLEKLARGNSEE